MVWPLQTPNSSKSIKLWLFEAKVLKGFSPLCCSTRRQWWEQYEEPDWRLATPSSLLIENSANFHMHRPGLWFKTKFAAILKQCYEESLTYIYSVVNALEVCIYSDSEQYFANAAGVPLQMNDVFVHCPITPSPMEIFAHISKHSDRVSCDYQGNLSF